MTERLTLSYTGSFWRKMETWLSQWDSQDGAQCFSALTPWGSEKRRETWCLNQQSAISRAAAGKGPEEGCVQELRPALPTLALPPGLTSGLRRELALLTLFTEAQCLQTQGRPRGPRAWLCARVSWAFCSPVFWADSTGSACESGCFLIRAFGGFVFVVVYVAVLGLSCSTAELHCILQDLFLFSSNVASPIQWTWTWADTWRRWGPGKPGVLQSMGLQRVRQDLVTEQQHVQMNHCAVQQKLTHGKLTILQC